MRITLATRLLLAVLLLAATKLPAQPPVHEGRDSSLLSHPRGAQMPYLKYEAEDGDSGGGATVVGPSMDYTKPEAEASGRKYVKLIPVGAYVQWQVQQPARGMVLRFTIPDSADGTGLEATLGLYLNGTRIASLPLTSRYSWQYFEGTMHPSNDPEKGFPLKRFDDIRFIFPRVLTGNDVIRLQKDAVDTSPTYGIDFIELEPISDIIPPPTGALDVSQPPYSADPSDSADSINAFHNCMSDAKAQGKAVYIPPGRFRLGRRLQVADVHIQGAGIWYSELHFTKSDCGLIGDGSVTVNDLFLTSETTGRSGTPGIGGYFGAGSRFSNVWVEHFIAGAMIADFWKNRITDGLVFSHCRFRNTFADGVNFANGSRNCTVEQSNFRNNGDDAMATWPSGTNTVPETCGIVFQFNTVENTYRAAGLGIFGGRGHIAHDCIIRDVVGGSGIRFTTGFPSHPFSHNEMIVVSNMTLIRTGTRGLWKDHQGAITLSTRRLPLQNIQFSNIDIEDSYEFGIYYEAAQGCPITNICCNAVKINDSRDYGIYVKNGATGWSRNSGVVVTGSGIGAVFNHSNFELRKDLNNIGW
jgi:hypothetical protein